MAECVAYLLRSETDGNFYEGQTTNLIRRMAMHNSGQVKSTRNRRPLKLLGYKIFSSVSEARYYEYQVKHHSDKKHKFVADILRLSEPEARTH
jgi:putative endonuclease